MRVSPLAGAIALAFVALACTAVAMHSAHRQTELFAAMPPYMSSLEEAPPRQGAQASLRQQQMTDIDSNSDDPAAEFLKSNEEGEYDDDDDVEVTSSRPLATCSPGCERVAASRSASLCPGGLRLWMAELTCRPPTLWTRQHVLSALVWSEECQETFGSHPGVELRANLKSISHRCHPIQVAFVWELTKKNIHLPWVASERAMSGNFLCSAVDLRH